MLDFTPSVEEEFRWWETDYMSVILPFFELYLEYASKQALVFEREETGERLVLPYTTRFDRSYKRKVRGRLGGIFFLKGTHLVITTDLNQYLDPISATRSLKRVLEFSFEGGHGSPHLHILLNNLFLNRSDLKRLHKIVRPHCRWIKVKRFYNIKVWGYVLKYVRKGLVVGHEREISKASLYSAALYWLIGSRLFTTSRGLLPSPKRKRKTCIFLGIYPRLLRVYPLEENLALLDDFEFLCDVRASDDWYWSSRIRKLRSEAS